MFPIIAHCTHQIIVRLLIDVSSVFNQIEYQRKIDVIHICLKIVIARTRYGRNDSCEKHVCIPCDLQVRTTIDIFRLSVIEPSNTF